MCIRDRSYPIESWAEWDTGSNYGQITPANNIRLVAQHIPYGGEPHRTELTLGQGASSTGKRRTAIVTANVYTSGAGQPCSMQATATYWQS